MILTINHYFNHTYTTCVISNLIKQSLHLMCTRVILNINYTLRESSSTICSICVNLNINCVLNKSCYFFWGKIVKQFALFSEKFTQLLKNFTRPPVSAVPPNINSGKRAGPQTKTSKGKDLSKLSTRKTSNDFGFHWWCMPTQTSRRRPGWAWTGSGVPVCLFFGRGTSLEAI